MALCGFRIRVKAFQVAPPVALVPDLLAAVITLLLPRERYWCFIAAQPAPTPHLANPEGCAAPRIVLVTVPRVIYYVPYRGSACRRHYSSPAEYRGTSTHITKRRHVKKNKKRRYIKKRHSRGPYSRPLPRALGWS